MSDDPSAHGNSSRSRADFRCCTVTLWACNAPDIWRHAQHVVLTYQPFGCHDLQWHQPRQQQAWTKSRHTSTQAHVNLVLPVWGHVPHREAGRHLQQVHLDGDDGAAAVNFAMNWMVRMEGKSAESGKEENR
jgi:hypothetical protein